MRSNETQCSWRDSQIGRRQRSFLPPILVSTPLRLCFPRASITHKTRVSNSVSEAKPSQAPPTPAVLTSPPPSPPCICSPLCHSSARSSSSSFPLSLTHTHSPSKLRIKATTTTKPQGHTLAVCASVCIHSVALVHVQSARLAVAITPVLLSSGPQKMMKLPAHAR